MVKEIFVGGGGGRGGEVHQGKICGFFRWSSSFRFDWGEGGQNLKMDQNLSPLPSPIRHLNNEQSLIEV